MLDVESKNKRFRCRMLVIGVGGAGNNAVNRMIDMGMGGVDYLSINTDNQDLDNNKSPQILHIGNRMLGAGSNPESGKKAAEESRDEIAAAIKDYDMIFITCGMGGGTGTGASPVVAEIAKSMGILTIAVVTKPFKFEGTRRMNNAKKGIERLSKCVDTVIVIPNDKLRLLPENENMDFSEGILKADEVLHHTVRGITEILSNTAEINLDFRDVQTIMRDKGVAHIGIGSAEGKDRAETAIKRAIESPLLETTIKGATDVILFVRGNVMMKDTEAVGDYVIDLVGYDVQVIYGVMVDESMGDTLSVTLIATGMNTQNEPDASIEKDMPDGSNTENAGAGVVRDVEIKPKGTGYPAANGNNQRLMNGIPSFLKKKE